MGEMVLQERERWGPRMRKTLQKVAVLGMVCMTLTVPVYATPSEDGNVEKPKETNVSLYDTQIALSAYVNDVLGVNGNDKHEHNRVESTSKIPGNIGNAGAYVGYGDEDAGFHSFIMSNVSYGVSGSTYDAWQDVTRDDPNQVYAYARYGRLLRATGLDDVASENHSSFRGFLGLLSTFAFALAQLIPMMFSLALKLLKFLNPFGFLANANAISAGFASWIPNAPPELTAVVNFISHVFDLIVNHLTWLVAAPALLCVAITQVIMLRKPAGSVFTKYAKRILFFVIGIPFCAGLYTNVVDEMFDIMTHNTAAAQVVASTMIDFESWCETSQLGVPSDAVLESAPGELSEGEYTFINGGTPTDKTLLNLRKSAYALNRANNKGLGNLPSVDSIDSVHFTTSANMWNGSLQHTTSGTGTQAFAGITPLTKDFKVTGSLLDMLVRYTTQEFYRPTDFETSYMNLLTTKYREDLGHMGSTAGASSNKGRIYEMFDRTNNVEDWMERSETANRAVWTGSALGANTEDGHHMQWVGKDWSIYKGGDLKVSSLNPDAVMTYTTDRGEKGLSIQSMYNFLCTSFDDNSLMVYSSDRSVSEVSRQLHYSTNVIGTGLLQFVFTLNMIVLMGVLVLIAFSFTFKMAVHNIKKGISLLTSIPMAMMGVMKSIAQVMSYTVAMVLELITTAFLYVIVSDVLVLVALTVENVVSVGLSTTDGSGTVTLLASLANTMGISMETMLVAGVIGETLLIIGLMLFAWKYRKIWFYVRHTVSNRVYRLCTLPDMEIVYETGMNPVKQDMMPTKLEWISFPQLVKGYLQCA